MFALEALEGGAREAIITSSPYGSNASVKADRLAVFRSGEMTLAAVGRVG